VYAPPTTPMPRSRPACAATSFGSGGVLAFRISMPQVLGFPEAPEVLGFPEASEVLGFAEAPQVLGFLEAPQTLGFAEATQVLDFPEAPEVLGFERGVFASMQWNAIPQGQRTRSASKYKQTREKRRHGKMG